MGGGEGVARQENRSTNISDASDQLAFELRVRSPDALCTGGGGARVGKGGVQAGPSGG